MPTSAQRDADRNTVELELKLADERHAREFEAKKETVGDWIRSGVLYLLVTALVRIGGLPPCPASG